MRSLSVSKKERLTLFTKHVSFELSASSRWVLNYFKNNLHTGLNFVYELVFNFKFI